MKPHGRFISPSFPTHGSAAGTPSPRGRGSRPGSGLVVALVTLLVVTSIMGSIMHALLTELRQTRQTVIEVQAQWLADAAVERAAARLSADPNYAGESWNVDFPGSSSAPDSRGDAEIKIERGDNEKVAQIVVFANYPNDSRRRVSAKRAVSVPLHQKHSAASNSHQEANP